MAAARTVCSPSARAMAASCSGDAASSTAICALNGDAGAGAARNSRDRERSRGLEGMD